MACSKLEWTILYLKSIIFVEISKNFKISKKKGTRFYFNGTQMDFEDKYKDYTSTFLVSPGLKKSDKNETKNTKNGLIRQNGDM